jgi:hypothetical protein
MLIVFSVAMHGSTIVDRYGAQHVEVTKSGLEFLWCYSSPNSPNDFLCYPNHGECSMVQSADDDAKSDCLKKQNGS